MDKASPVTVLRGSAIWRYDCVRALMYVDDRIPREFPWDRKGCFGNMSIDQGTKMGSSDEALSFFKEWMDIHKKVFVTAVLEGVVVNGSGVITSLAEWGVLVSDGVKFSIHIPLEGCSFNAYDPERGSGHPAFDEVVRELGYSFGWEVILPSNDRILLSELDLETDPAHQDMEAKD